MNDEQRILKYFAVLSDISGRDHEGGELLMAAGPIYLEVEEEGVIALTLFDSDDDEDGRVYLITTKRED